MSMAGIPLTPLEVGRSGLAQCFVSGELGGVAGEIGGDAGEIGGDAGGGRFSFMKDHASCAHCNSGLSAAPSAACRLPSVALLTAAALSRAAFSSSAARHACSMYASRRAFSACASRHAFSSYASSHTRT